MLLFDELLTAVERLKVNKTAYYSLLYIDQNHKHNANLIGGGDPIDVYLSCACLCFKAFRLAGASFSLVTNDASDVRRRLEYLDLSSLPIVSRKFSLSVPHGLPFFSAHFKLDLFHGFASGDFGSHVGFVDLDTVLLRKLPECNSLGVYDISDQVLPVYEQRRIVADIEKISGKRLPDARWYGGEFIVGSAEMFGVVSSYVEEFWESYTQNVKSLAHIGDEMLVSAALNFARLEGIELIDFGKNGLVARWWTTRTQHQQAPFDLVRGAALLHLPADKPFLAAQAGKPFDSDAFVNKFRRHVRRKCFSRGILHIGEGLLKRPKRFLPKLTAGGRF